MGKYRYIKVRGFERPEPGIFLKNGKRWMLLKDNPMDFIIDGFLFIGRKYVLREVYSNDLEFMNEVMTAKNEFSEISFPAFDLNNDEALFKQFLDEERLIQVCLHNQKSTLVGKVISVSKKSFRMKLLSTKGMWLKDFNFKYETIRTINVDSDYLRSFKLLARLK